MSQDAVLIEREGPIAIVTLNRPETRNALSDDVIDGLASFLEGANADEGLGCIVLKGAGKGFCSGGNVKEMHEKAHPMYRGSPHQMQEAYRANVQRIPLAFDTLDVPVVVAVHGAAVGAGCDLAFMGDIRVATPDAVFAESFLRVGLVSGDGGAWVLPRVLGLARATEMALTGMPVTAERAEKWGVISRIVPAEDLHEAAMEYARAITAHPPRSIRLNKRLLRRSSEASLRDALELAAAFQALVQNTEDQREAVAAFVEKRKPSFTGR